jgi:hypothetical protein
VPVTMDIKLTDFLAALYEEGSSHPVAQRAIALQEKGWSFGFQMFLINATKGLAQVPENMPSLIPALMGGKTTGQQLAIFRVVFEKFIGSVEGFEKAGTDEVSQKTGEDSAEASKVKAAKDKKAEFVKKIAAGIAAKPSNQESAAVTAVLGTVAQAASPPKVVPGIAKLRDATFVGQMVYGSSEGSFYKTVAIGPVNVAAKVGTGAVSLRVESPSITPQVIKLLAEMGFSNKKEYLSMHCALSPTMPASRVVGAVLLGLNMQFKEVITNGSDIK